MMTDLPARITPAEFADLLDQLSGLTEASPLEQQITWHERKALLLSRLADRLDTAEAHLVASGAWHYVGRLARQRDLPARTEVTR